MHDQLVMTAPTTIQLELDEGERGGGGGGKTPYRQAGEQITHHETIPL